jgi:RNA polymerase sigma-70 factor, ECF subfamily
LELAQDCAITDPRVPPREVLRPAFEQVYAEHAAFTWRALRHLGLPEVAVDDAMQELWVVVHRRLAEFEGRSELKSWLFGIALNVARNQRRSLRRQQVNSAALAQPLALVRPADEQQEALELVHGFLATLADERRELFVCCLLEGLSAAEAADATGVELVTVQNRVRALRRSFKTWIIRQRSPE